MSWQVSMKSIGCNLRLCVEQVPTYAQKRIRFCWLTVEYIDATLEMRVKNRIFGAITGALAPVMAVASDFHWPEFHFDQTPVTPLDLNGVVSQISQSLGTLGVIFVVAALIVSIWGYAKALTEVKMGRLIVYKDWGDFLKSSAWVLLLPIGAAWYSNDSGSSLFRMIGLGTIAYGCCCFWQMLSGAFKYNVGNEKWLSLFARIAVTALILFALAKLKEEFDNYKRGKYGYKYRYFAFMRGIILPLTIFSLFFKLLIQPMIGTQYYRLRRNIGGW